MNASSRQGGAEKRNFQKTLAHTDYCRRLMKSAVVPWAPQLTTRQRMGERRSSRWGKCHRRRKGGKTKKGAADRSINERGKKVSSGGLSQGENGGEPLLACKRLSASLFEGLGKQVGKGNL